VFENRVLRVVLGHTKEEVAGGWKGCIMRSFIIVHFIN
jgi:acid phosphatase family membrane protein YuiD